MWLTTTFLAPSTRCDLQLQPEGVYFVGGFGVLSKWIPVPEYEVGSRHALAPWHGRQMYPSHVAACDCLAWQTAVPDVLAHDVSRIVNRLNMEHEAELRLMCRHFLNVNEVDQVQAMAVDRLGIDLRSACSRASLPGGSVMFVPHHRGCHAV